MVLLCTKLLLNKLTTQIHSYNKTRTLHKYVSGEDTNEYENAYLQQCHVILHYFVCTYIITLWHELPQ